MSYISVLSSRCSNRTGSHSSNSDSTVAVRDSHPYNTIAPTSPATSHAHQMSQPHPSFALPAEHIYNNSPVRQLDRNHEEPANLADDDDEISQTGSLKSKPLLPRFKTFNSADKKQLNYFHSFNLQHIKQAKLSLQSHEMSNSLPSLKKKNGNLKTKTGSGNTLVRQESDSVITIDQEQHSVRYKLRNGHSDFTLNHNKDVTDDNPYDKLDRYTDENEYSHTSYDPINLGSSTAVNEPPTYALPNDIGVGSSSNFQTYANSNQMALEGLKTAVEDDKQDYSVPSVDHVLHESQGLAVDEIRDAGTCSEHSSEKKGNDENDDYIIVD